MPGVRTHRPFREGLRADPAPDVGPGCLDSQRRAAIRVARASWLATSPGPATAQPRPNRPGKQLRRDIHDHCGREGSDLNIYTHKDAHLLWGGVEPWVPVSSFMGSRLAEGFGSSCGSPLSVWEDWSSFGRPVRQVGSSGCWCGREPVRGRPGERGGGALPR